MLPHEVYDTNDGELLLALSELEDVELLTGSLSSDQAFLKSLILEELQERKQAVGVFDVLVCFCV